MPNDDARRAPRTLVKTTHVYISRSDWNKLHTDFKTTIDGEPWVLQLSEVTGATELRHARIVDDVDAVDVEPDALTAEIIGQLAEQIPDAVAFRAFQFAVDREGWADLFLPALQRRISVEYVPGRDLYTVTVHDTTNTGASLHATTYEGVYADQLGDLLAQPRHGGTRPLFAPRPINLEVRVTGWDDFPELPGSAR